MTEKNMILFLLIAGTAATAYGMLRENNYVFIPGIVMVAVGYCLIRKNLKRSKRKQQDTDAPDTPAPSDDN